MVYIKINEGSKKQREFLYRNIHEMDLLSSENRDKVITAWVTSINNSSFESLDLVPYSMNAPSYKLINHVNEVIDIGIKLYKFYTDIWGGNVDLQDLLQILILHDLDKPLLFTYANGNFEDSEIAKKIPHGVLGSYILEDLKFSEKTVYAVATHSIYSSVHGSSPEDLILHYSDFFSADHAILMEGKKAFFQKIILK